MIKAKSTLLFFCSALYRAFLLTSPSQYFYIGLHASSKNESFQWLNNYSLHSSDSLWYKNQYKYCGADEYCGAVQFNFATGSIFDVCCLSNYQAICEK